MLLSVALCTHNGSAHLREQLGSLAGQGRLPDELVACDDRSSDDTLTTLSDFAAGAPFPVRVYANPANLGTTKNFERAVSLCTGDVIFLCDQDDVWRSEKFARFEAAFADPGVLLAASDLELIDVAGRPLNRRVWADLRFSARAQAAVERGDGPRVWVRSFTITGAAMAFRSSLRELVLPVPGCWHHDAWVAFIAGAVGGVKLISEPLTRYRSHSNQQIGVVPHTLGRQFRAARRMNAAYFARVVECFDALAERLATFRDRLRDPGLVEFVKGKANFARVQQRMREGWRVGRVLPAVRELVTGRYHRFGRGWKGFAADLIL